MHKFEISLKKYIYKKQPPECKDIREVLAARPVKELRKT